VFESNAECGGNWVGEGQYMKAVKMCVSVTMDANETAEGRGSVSINHDCLCRQVIPLIDDCVYMVVGHGASAAREVKHFTK
jgi:hypothetical protein